MADKRNCPIARMIRKLELPKARATLRHWRTTRQVNTLITLPKLKEHPVPSEEISLTRVTRMELLRKE